MASQSGRSTTRLPSARARFGARFRALRAAALQQGHRASGARLSSIALRVEQFLNDAGADRLPWLAVGFAGGIGLWFALANSCLWSGVVVFGLAVALGALALISPLGAHGHLRLAVAAMALAISAGCAVIWAKSALVGTPPIAAPVTVSVTARVLDRYAQPADHKLRLQLAFIEPGGTRPIRASVTMPDHADAPGLNEGAVVRLRVRLMPPGPPSLPGGYDAARQAWFDGVAATGTAAGPVEVLAGSAGDDWLARARHALSDHVRARVAGSPGGMAAAFASGDRGGISAADEQAMRDSGLTHLLSVSGLHVSAVIAGTYVLALRLLGLVPWLVLRFRLPLLASGAGGLAGLGYTVLTGAQVPTVRSVLGALLVLGALALGRQAFSLRLLAVSCACVMLLWPEAVVSPTFQMSFGSVLAIVAVHDNTLARAFLAPRGEVWWRRLGRHLAMILLTGMVIDVALMPIALFHFHRAGIYGALANLIAIPLTTFVSMPAIAAGLALDLVGAGAPAWWVCGQSLHMLLAMARWVAARPDAVTMMPMAGAWRFVLAGAGMLWLALWHGRLRLWGLVPVVLVAVSLAWIRAPDVLITGDGRSIAVTGLIGHPLVILREGRSAYVRDAMLESAGLDDRSPGASALDGATMAGPVTPMTQWPGAQCSQRLCSITLERGGRSWRVLMLRGSAEPAPAVLNKACARADIVIAPAALQGPCQPARLKADGALLSRTGGLALDLAHGSVTTVAQTQGDHPWWRASR
jgi:competence protein ComEC